MNWNIKSYNGYLRLNPDFNLSDISFFNQTAFSAAPFLI